MIWVCFHFILAVVVQQYFLSKKRMTRSAVYWFFYGGKNFILILQSFDNVGGCYFTHRHFFILLNINLCKSRRVKSYLVYLYNYIVLSYVHNIEYQFDKLENTENNLIRLTSYNYLDWVHKSITKFYNFRLEFSRNYTGFFRNQQGLLRIWLRIDVISFSFRFWWTRNSVFVCVLLCRSNCKCHPPFTPFGEYKF